MLRKASAVIVLVAFILCAHAAVLYAQDEVIPSLKSGKVYRLSDLRKTELNDSKTTLFWGKNMLVNIITFEADPAVQTLILHSHPHEQFTICTHGEYTMTVGEDTFVMKTGDVCYIPPNVKHGGTFSPSEGATLLDVFSPVREEFIEKAREQGTDMQ